MEEERKEVSRIEVGKYYLKTELNRLLPGKARSFIEEGVDKLEGKELWRFLEALSLSYRLNGVFFAVSDDSFTWSEEEIYIKDVVITGMTQSINKVIFSEEINQDTLKFREFLLEYFEKHKKTDPQNLGQLRPKNKRIIYRRIIVKEDGGKYHIVDGMNRFTAQLLRGKKKVKAFVGRKTRHGKPMIGDSVFVVLRKAYELGNETEKKSVLTVVRKLIKYFSDGLSAMKNYWIEPAYGKKEVRNAGKKLLEEIEESGH